MRGHRLQLDGVFPKGRHPIGEIKMTVGCLDLNRLIR